MLNQGSQQWNLTARISKAYLNIAHNRNNIHSAILSNAIQMRRNNDPNDK